MADLREQLQKEGWHFSDEGLKQLTDDGKITNTKIILKKALDIDLREVAAPGFPEEVGRCKVEGVPGGLVVQLQKVRNVSAPKANEESQAAPRMLKVTLTDGHSTCHAVEIERIPALTLNTPPGTKILLKSSPGEENIPVCSNFLLINGSRAEILGGRVSHMIEKWELNRSLAKHKRSWGEDGGPPAWIPFGQKIVRSNPADKNFKSLQEKDKQAVEALNPEFEAQRKDAIAEAGKAVAKKVFGGGNRQLLDHNVQQIVEFGFTIEQADHALKMNRNNVDRALKSLQRQTEGPKPVDRKSDKDSDSRNNRENPREGGRESTRGPGLGKGSSREGGKSRGHDDEVGSSSQTKPSGRLSLFDFLEDKLPLEEREKLQASSRGTSDRGRGGGRGGYANGRDGRGSQFQDRDREPRGGLERGGRGGGRGRGAAGPGGRPDRARDPRDESRFKERKDNPRGRDQPEIKGKREAPANSRAPSKAKGPPDFKAPRFQNPKTPLQHESTRYLGHTPSNAVSTNSSLGHESSEWGASLARKVDMMSLIDCDNTPDDDPTYSNGSWANNQRSSQPHLRQNDNGRNLNQGPHNPKPNHSNYKQNNDYRNNSYDNDVYGSKGSMGPPGMSRNAFNNQSFPKIPDFPFKDNMNLSNPLINGGYSSNNTNGVNNSSNTRNSGSSRNSENGRNMPGAPCDVDGPGVFWSWSLGDACLARYWEDERYYDAVVTGIAARTLVVRFTEYGNHEEVLKQDTVPVTKAPFSEPLKNALNNGCSPSSLPAEIYFNLGDAHCMSPGTPSKSIKSSGPPNPHNPYDSNGSVEFRRGGTRAYVKPSPSPNVAMESQMQAQAQSRRPARAPQSMYVPPAQRK
ncbi:tudor domain-containing protein 3 isoform X2 [Thrips palmi]|uniref:Tudor domain-containing protein 3 n=1 Tax=Thrips palmi TaxID=161013 RepID=A0A6P8ZQG9_THRPL|nr:tudor domain-containing protein 3 isoform X2 [Thrips palmi]